MFNVEEILAKSDLYELVRRAGGELDNHGRCACPLHGSKNENGFSVYVKDGKQLWNCFSGSCGGGDAIAFVQAWQGMDFKHACGFLGGDVMSDPLAMAESARRRHEEAERKQAEANAKVDARRRELQQEELYLQYHERMNEWARAEWIERGVPVDWQGFYYVGGCDDKLIMYKGVEYHTPTLTIPIFDEKRNLLNIKHRLMNPPKPTDKYRPEREGLGTSPPFLAMPELGYDGGAVWVIEGEIKAMVSCIYAGNTDWQFIGVPGRTQYKSLTDKLKGKNVIVVPDPGAEKDAADFCKSVGGRWLSLPNKIDDFVLANGYDGDSFRAWERQARRIR